MVILILTQANDGHAPPVENALHSLGAEVIRSDLADFPEQITLSAHIERQQSWSGVLTYHEQTAEIEDIRSIWWRRPQRYHAPDRYAPAVRDFVEREAYQGLLGVVQAVPGKRQPFWVSPLESIRAAEFKPVQLAAAQGVGLRVPRTLLTNEPQAARDFYDLCHGQVMCKAVARGILDPAEAYQQGEERFLYTNAVKEDHLDWLEGVGTTAHLFQEAIAKALDVRVVMIGRQVFAVEIHAHSERARIDWRRAYADLSYAVHQLPDDVEQKLVSLVRRFGLQFSSADLLLTPAGEYVFLELNPNGQFYWLEPPTAIPLAKAMANLLAFPEEYAL